ncbi:MAG: hypothetical protein J6C26_10285 [Clostridia bacterium]|nr:hypothetical protein [Clostridia bacterium]
MKKIFTLLLFAALLCGLCTLAFAAEQPSAEELLKQVPSYAHTGEKESILTVSGLEETGQSLLSIFFYGLGCDGFLSEKTTYFQKPPTEEQLAACPKVSAEDVEKTLVRLFGPDATTRFGELRDRYMSRGYLVLERLEDGSYAYYQYSYGGGEGSYTRDCFLRSETVGNDVVVYSRFLQAPPRASSIFWVSGSVSSDMVLLDLDQQEKKALPEYINPWNMIDKGMFDEYLPTYKHTFKPNGDGTYYWAQTELDTAGKEIPLSVFEKEEQYLKSLVATVPKEAYRGAVTNSNYQSHSKLTYSRLYGDGYDTLFVNEAYAEWTVEGTSLILYSPRGNEKTGGQITLGTWENVSPDKNQASIEGLIRDEKFVQYYTVYRHTFQKKADGTYSWVETIVDQYGEEMPVILTGGSANSNTDSTTDTTSDVTTSEVMSDTSTDTATDASTGTVTDAVPDVSTGSATDVVPQEEGSSAVWIVVAVVAVAAVAAVAVFFVLKKKKA